MPATLIHLFARYGYFLIFGAVLLENAGVPSPGHTVMLAGGALAQQGHLSLPLVIATGALSAIIGDNAGYLIGRRGGRALLLKYGKRFWITPERLAKAEQFFEVHGPKAVFLARFVTGLQTVGALLAGASRMHWRTFFLWNFLGAITWATIYALLGYAFGASWSLLERWVGHAGIFLLAIVGVALAVTAIRHRAALEHKLDRILPAGFDKLQALLGLAALGAAGLFAKISEDVVEHESTAFDRVVSLGVHSFDRPWLDVVMRVFTFIGSFPSVAIVVVAICVWCWRRQEQHALRALLAVVAADEAINFGLKHAFARPRPDLFQEIATLHSYSFPSGHAMAAASIYGMVVVVAGRLAPRWKLWIGTAGGTLVLLIGLSRIYLGVHWATDVLAGYAAGAVLLFGGVLWFEIRSDRASAPAIGRRVESRRGGNLAD